LFTDIAAFKVESLSGTPHPHLRLTTPSGCTGVETIFEVAAAVEEKGARVEEEAAAEVRDELEVRELAYEVSM